MYTCPKKCKAFIVKDINEKLINFIGNTTGQDLQDGAIHTSGIMSQYENRSLYGKALIDSKKVIGFV
jgi:hypothetical protein